jgi:hypothetical protein
MCVPVDIPKLIKSYAEGIREDKRINDRKAKFDTFAVIAIIIGIAFSGAAVIGLFLSQPSR